MTPLSLFDQIKTQGIKQILDQFIKHVTKASDSLLWSYRAKQQIEYKISSYALGNVFGINHLSKLEQSLLIAYRSCY